MNASCPVLSFLLFWQVRRCLLVTGFTLLFGALFAKTYRVYVIFRENSIRKKVNLINSFVFLARDIGIDSDKAPYLTCQTWRGYCKEKGSYLNSYHCVPNY